MQIVPEDARLEVEAWVDNKQVKLTSRMSVAVELKTGQRRLIEYFLSPLKKYSQESIRER